MKEEITHVTFEVSCDTCKFSSKKFMKCTPESEDCNPNYDLEESDFITLKKCDFWHPKDGMYFWVSTQVALPTYNNQIVLAKVKDSFGRYMTKAHYNANKEYWFDEKGRCLKNNVYEWAIEM